MVSSVYICYVMICSHFMCCSCDDIVIDIVVFFFFFKQKTAYEMRISDWSSDVCSSDLKDPDILVERPESVKTGRVVEEIEGEAPGWSSKTDRIEQIGRASCRERVCQYV